MQMSTSMWSMNKCANCKCMCKSHSYISCLQISLLTFYLYIVYVYCNPSLLSSQTFFISGYEGISRPTSHHLLPITFCFISFHSILFPAVVKIHSNLHGNDLLLKPTNTFINVPWCAAQTLLDTNFLCVVSSHINFPKMYVLVIPCTLLVVFFYFFLSFHCLCTAMLMCLLSKALVPFIYYYLHLRSELCKRL